MLVRFKANWFAPTDVEIRDKVRHISGRRFRKGVQEVPDVLRPFLPASAEVVDKNWEKEETVEEEQTLKDFDTDRAAADEVERVAEKAEKTATEKRRENVAKARAAAEKKRAAQKEMKEAE